jgi:putative nucleotidyltransferase with HDIG domain
MSMNDERLSLLVNRFGIYYGTVDEKLRVRFIDEGVFAFLKEKPTTNWIELTEFFPEVVGIEEDILQIIRGEREEYTILSVSRELVDEIFFNIYFLRNAQTPRHCVIVVKDLTNELLYRQAIQQKKNEIELLQNILIEKNVVLDVTNRELLASQDELQLFNRDLEIKVQERTRQLEESTKLAQRLFHQTVNALMLALEKRDTYTVGHQQRVADLACAIAREMGFDEFAVEGMLVAGNLHDIGKIYVPYEFLTKPGTLSGEEFGVIKAHPRMGFEILSGIEFPWPVAMIVLQHHERLDGSGYPEGLRGPDISIEAKILSVADVVEAMATSRPYRMSPGLDVALEEIQKDRGVRYDSRVVDICVDLFTTKKYNWQHVFIPLKK